MRLRFSKLWVEKTGEALAQAVAEYLRLFGENEAIRHYFKSADYLTQSLENLKRT